MPFKFIGELFRRLPSGRLVRCLQPLQEGEALIRSPASIDDLALTLAFCLEALELDDFHRYSDARGLLSEYLHVLRTESGLKPSAGAIEDLIGEKLLRRELASYDYVGREMGKLTSKALWQFRHLPSEFGETKVRIFEAFDEAIHSLPELIHSKAFDEKAQIIFLEQLLKCGYSAINESSP